MVFRRRRAIGPVYARLVCIGGADGTVHMLQHMLQHWGRVRGRVLRSHRTTRTPGALAPDAAWQKHSKHDDECGENGVDHKVAVASVGKRAKDRIERHRRRIS
eukprot:CAMPEP_0181232116 /NCGR_PEP_ID=MMETSP1096-20121128/35519_1 /TAXON_ID=156174 ORGANISM="Chrysochromulina ericina, Strain CCMP281" /NCGR_SAMPLE_ID=MMETSP1096 /ASSEMBLY_ACC=CAM_ASM_000453 /LENGTH=102 /DNA_ID=CAMNT_0023326305 /DNA_START=105 /DNA_END=417 /DNA_ORIENTATION=-